MSDDENELELLRTAALQTLKMGVKKLTTNIGKQVPMHTTPLTSYHQYLPSNRRKFAGLSRGGALRNGQFNGRTIRNPNLISIPTMQPHVSHDVPQSNNANSVRLDLPQNRYCNKMNVEANSLDSKKGSSKFSRYDDNSDSESDISEIEGSEGEEKLVRSQSLEALVQELEFEISGEKPAACNKAKAKKGRQDMSDDERKLNDNEVDVETKNEEVVELLSDFREERIDNGTQSRAETKTDVTHPVNVHTACSVEHNSTRKPDDRLSDTALRRFDGPVGLKPVTKSPQRAGLLPKPRGFILHLGLYEPPGKREPALIYTNSPNQTFQHQFQPQYLPPHGSYAPIQPAQHYYRSNHAPAVNVSVVRAGPLSPLTLRQEAMSTIAMAPLSPRSAAFVLQNREIIEKRKRSPRHSYSRSPSPRARRSKSPRRRSPSPRRYPRSSSPRRRVRSSPKRRARSPAERTERSAERATDRSPRRDVKERLTLNNNKRVGRSAMSLTPTKQRQEGSPERSGGGVGDGGGGGKPVEKDRDNKERDPVLEARRKKFEQQNTVSKEGVIRLKPNIDDGFTLSPGAKLLRSSDDEQQGETPEVVKVPSEHETEAECGAGADALDEDTLQTNVDELFSDEESEDENEGRFKSGTQAKRSAPMLRFAALGALSDVQHRTLEEPGAQHEWRDRDRGRRDDRRARRRERSRSAREPFRKYKSPLPPERKERGERKEARRGDDAQRRNRDERQDERKLSIKERLTARRDDKESKNEQVKVAVEVSAGKKKSERAEVRMKSPLIKMQAGDCVVAVDLNAGCSKERANAARRVAIAIEKKGNKECKAKDVVTVIEDDDDDDVVKKNEAGDLRAQLSRKRAERQSQKPSVNAEDVQSRLLHNALGAVFQKSQKRKRNEGEAAPKEKRPIHQRLGLSDEAEMKKKKAKRSTEQV